MKRLLVFVVTMFFSLAMTAGGHDRHDRDDNQHHKFRQDGAFANLQATIGPTSSISLQVSRGFSTTSGSSASLSYTAFEQAPDFSSFTITNIFGTIPSSAFTGKNTERLILDFDTSQFDPSISHNETCTLIFDPFSFVCVPGPLGRIHLEFEENGKQRTQILEFDEVITSGLVTTHIHQRSDNSSADVEGSVFGMPVSGPFATVGVNHDSSLEIIRN